ncbi:MAG: glycosyltransferase family 4 protein [Candidatus Zipacnadales bacterium]
MPENHPRVAQLIPWLSLGGATGLVLRMSESLRARGYAVEIVTGNSTEAGVSMAPLAQELGIPLHIVPSFRRAPSPLHDWRALHELTRLFRDSRFDIVHSHGTKALLLGTWAARRANIKATVWHVHGWGFHDYSSAISRLAIIWAHRLMHHTASCITAVSEATKRQGLAARIGCEDDYRVIYEAVDLDRFHPLPLSPSQAKARLGLDPNRPVVGCTARLSDQKAPLDLVEAAALVVYEAPDVQFLIVGDGPLWRSTWERVKKLGLQKHVSMPGARWDIPEVLVAIDVFVLTSLWEGFPICYLEAMAMGKPVVGTDVGGAAEAVLDGETGYIVPPRQPKLVADRILKLLRDEDLCRRMGAAGRRHAAQYGYDRLITDVANLYTELMNGLAR